MNLEDLKFLMASILRAKMAISGPETGILGIYLLEFQ
jgi:hypothetical protein